MTPLHFLYSLHMLSVNPVFWLVLDAVGQAYRRQDTRRIDDWETKASPQPRNVLVRLADRRRAG